MSNSVTLWTIALQSPLSIGLSRQEYWSGLQCSSPGDVPDPGSNPGSLQLDGHEFEQALGVGDGQGRLACCSPWGRKELDMTQRLN